MHLPLAISVAWLLAFHSVGLVLTATNPPMYLDYADIDVFQAEGVYYLSASNMHMSPGAPLLCSYDLVTWEAVGASVPVLKQVDARLAMDGGTGYVGGTWASAIRYRPNKKLWYWIGCIAGPWKTYVYTAESPAGPWKQAATIDECLYDVGLTIDKEDNMYVAYGHGPPITVAQLTPDGFKIAKKNANAVAQFPGSSGMIEGSRMYYADGNYYIFNTHPTATEYVSKSKNPMGPYESKTFFNGLSGPLAGSGSTHQGGLVETDDGSKPAFYGGFQDSFPAGRIPVFAPVSWSSDGWPTLKTSAGRAFPSSLTGAGKKSGAGCSGRPLGEGQGFLVTGIDNFKQATLHPSWQWNHDPDTTKYSVGQGGLVLATATVTTDIYHARNTLCRRIPGPRSYFLVALDVSKMADGDRAGIIAFREISASIGVEQKGSTRSIVTMSGMQIGGSKWVTQSEGQATAAVPLNATTVHLRIDATVAASAGGTASFSYSTDGASFKSVGTALKLSTAWQFYLGYQYCIFNHATKAAGGSVTVTSAGVGYAGAERHELRQTFISPE